MMAYLRNPLDLRLGVSGGSLPLPRGRLAGAMALRINIDAAITIGVLLIASVKAQLVIRYFMEVRSAPRWLKRTTYGWNIALLFLLLWIYSQSL